MYQEIKQAVNTFVSENAREPQVLGLHYEDYCEFKTEFEKDNGFCKNRNIIFEQNNSVTIGKRFSHWEIYVVRTTDIPKNTYKLI